MLGNQTLETLLLEWNSVGVCEFSFAGFCEGLAAHSFLVHLHLHDNQIDHTGAQKLRIALRLNSTLSTLDLHWNNIGLIGGRVIVGALQQNCGIAKVFITFAKVCMKLNFTLLS